jgi:hypothetical protein
MNQFRALQINAIMAIENETSDFFYRKVCRWFSHTYATPLMEVDNIPMQIVLQHYYEEVLGEMYDSDDEAAKQKYEDLRNRILFPDEYSEAVNDEELAIQKELAQMKKDLEKQVGKVGKDAGKAAQDALDNHKAEMEKLKSGEPNIIDEFSNLTLSGEDHEPLFDEY